VRVVFKAKTLFWPQIPIERSPIGTSITLRDFMRNYCAIMLKYIY
jgi:hypothetical protein